MKTLIILLLLSVFSSADEAFTTLAGSKEKVESAYQAAIVNDLTPLRDSDHVNKFIKLGLLVKLSGNNDYVMHGVSNPYVRPAAKLLVERLSAQYRKATGEKLVVTSASRTLDKQPWNASPKSVHPCGIAVDFRISTNKRAVAWMEKTLLIMQSRKIVLATREKRPPHFHVVVFPKAYTAYVATQQKKPAKK